MQRAREEPALGSVLIYLAGIVVGMASITLLFLGMRAVMDIGGACAEGGPYVPAQRCPDGVEFAMLGGTLGLFGAAGLMIWGGSRLGRPYPALVFLGWPALFLGLGWNFLEYGVSPPGGSGLEWGWLIPGVLFVLMGVGPLVVVVGALRAGAGSLPSRAARLDRLASRSSDSPWSAGTVGLPSESGRPPDTTTVSAAPPTGPTTADDDAAPGLVEQLERLTVLHDEGALDDAEFAAGKRRLLGEESVP